jgi:uncharacterized membrane protein YqjE
MNNHEKFPETQLHELTQLVKEMKRELVDFVTTRFELLRSEMRETMDAFKSAIPFGVIAVLLMLTGYLLLTLAVVGLIAVAFWGSPYAWFFAFLITGLAWTIFGVLAAYLAYNSLRKHGMFPKKTVEVLKADKIWMEREVSHQI